MNMSELFDRFIHDWPLPNAPLSESFVVMGCSHTTGVGLDIKDAYPSLMSCHYNLPVYNLAVGNGNADVCKLNLIQIFQKELPKFVVIQWPNPIRKLIWDSSAITITAMLENVNNGGEQFQYQLRINEEQFYLDWITEIKYLNTLFRKLSVPIINIYLDTLAPQWKEVLDDIEIHCDEKTPGKTWFFDSAAADGMHHSAWCHEQWTKRLIPLIDEATTR